MSEKLIQLADKRKPKVHYRGLVKNFTRPHLKREFEPVRSEELSLLPPIADELRWFTCRYSGPGDAYLNRRAIPLRTFGVKPELLIYRVLKDLYGPPDILTAALPKGAHESDDATGSAFPWEWSFMFKAPTDIYIEIHKQPGTQDPHISLWRPRLAAVDADSNREVAQYLMLFCKELNATLKESRHFIDSRHIKIGSTSLGPTNVYGELLAAGDDQMAASEFFRDRYFKQEARGVEAKNRINLGTFHLSAAIYYLLALEAFVNLLIELLRKEEFVHDIFDRATTKADFELRILSLPLYCQGFRNVPFPPDGEIFKSVRRLRSFRNNLLHGNVSRDDHVVYVLPEDHFLFYWWPAADDIDREKPFEKLPLARKIFGKGHAQAVRALVETIVDAVQSSMEPKYQAWIAGWRNRDFAPAVLKEARWEPNFNIVPAGRKKSKRKRKGK